jgi:hypothetical protein
VGCAADDAGPRSEIVSALDANVAMAFVRDGDSIYVARAQSLDRIDAQSGVVTTVAGSEWAECPRDPSLTWPSVFDDWSSPNVLVRGTTLTMVLPKCGVWSYDVVTKQRHMLVDGSNEEKNRRMKAEGVYPTGATWNGKAGPDWRDWNGMALAPDGDGLVACFTIGTYEQTSFGSSYRDALELWSRRRSGLIRQRGETRRTSQWITATRVLRHDMPQPKANSRRGGAS